MAPDTLGTLWTLGAAAAGGGISALGVVLAARMTAKPSEAAALTERYTALMDRQTTEREYLERQIAKLETVASDLEIMVLRLNEWRDEVVILMRMRGIVDYPTPPKYHVPQP